MGTFTIRHFRFGLLAFLVALSCGSVAFALILHERAVDAVYRAVVTMSLTGLDSRPPTTAGKIATVVLILVGVAIYTYIATALVELVARGVFTDAWAQRRNRRMIEELHDHYIICGFGRVGRRVASELREAGVPYVVLDFHPEAVVAAREAGELFVEGTGADDDDLEQAGLSRARGLVVSGDSDVDNLYITVTARSLRPDLYIVTRASEEAAGRKLRRAGADRVVQPYTSAGQEMAKLVLRPQVAAFLDVVTSAGGPDLRLEEIEVSAGCAKAGLSIRELHVRRETGALIIAIRRRDGSFATTPSPDTVLAPGDVMIAVGTDAELSALEELFRPRERVA